MRLSTKLFICILLLLVSLIIILIVSVQTTTEDFTLPTEGIKIFSIDLIEGWIYDFEVTVWSGDEVINISIMQGEEITFSVLLEGEKLDYEENMPQYLGYSFQVEETGSYQLVIQIIVEATQNSTHIKLIGTNNRVLGFDAIILILPIILALICACIALFGSFFYELFQTIKQKEKKPPVGILEVEMRISTSLEQCYYHKKQAIDQCEKCKRLICEDCVKVFNYPFSGTLLAFTEDVGEEKHNYCPICYWKSVSEMASSWSIRIVHLFSLFVILIILVIFFETVKPLTTTFSTPPSVSEWIILLFLAIFVIFIIGMGSLILYSLLIDAPRRTNNAKIKLQDFLRERGIVEDDLN